MYARTVFGIYLVPWQTSFLRLVIVETVLGVDNAPKRLEIIDRRVIRLFFTNATRAEKQGENGAEYKKDVMFHTDGGLQDKRAVLRLFAFDEAEMLHVAYHETMVPDMAAQPVHTTLADVAQIAGPERKSRNGKVQCQEMAHGRCVARISKAYVAVVVA